MKEILCINIGQAGVQMSSASWELFCIEHGLDARGFPRIIDSNSSDLALSDIHTFFSETNVGRYVPRAINIDLEPTVIDEIRCGVYRTLWHPCCLINGNEDAANNFARGRYTIGKKIIKQFFTQLLKMVRECKQLHGFILMNSLGGGTGSGFTSLLLDRIDVDYSKYTKVASVVYPAPHLTTSIVEPYNAILGSSMTVDQIDLALLCDNQAMYEICSEKLLIPRPHYTNLNRIVSQLFSSLTVTLRFGSSLDHDLVHLQTNLVPFPRIHFPFANYAPLVHQNYTDHETLTTAQITRELFESSNQLVKCEMENGKYMACCVQYRGLVAPRDVNLALLEIKNRPDIQFVDWCPTGFKVGISPMPPVLVLNSKHANSNRNVTMFSNSTAIEQAWTKLLAKFDLLYHKHAFIHWFVGEGMEEAEFKESREDIQNIQKDYEQLGSKGSSNDERLNSKNNQYNLSPDSENEKNLNQLENSNFCYNSNYQQKIQNFHNIY